MDRKLQTRIMAAWRELPGEVRHAPATRAQVAAFVKEFGPIPPDFKWFLENCGGGPVGSEWVDDIEELAETHRKFTKESAIPSGWTMKDVFIIGWDGGGNPFGIQSVTGKILVEDHDFGGIHEVAQSFAAMLASRLVDGHRT